MKCTQLTLLFAVLTTFTVVPTGFCKNTSKKLPSISKEGDELIRRIAALIRYYHIKNTNERELVYTACEGLTKGLDTYSIFLRPSKAKALNVETSGTFHGIGIEFTIEGDWLSVITPIEGSPAFNAGIRAGDTIIELGGKSTKFMSLAEATKIIRGKENSFINLTVYHIGDEEPTQYSIKRGTVQIQTIADAILIDDEFNTGYIRLIQFKKNSATELKEAILELQSQGMKNLILDLRANPGGVLNSAIKIADIFLDNGIIVTTKKRHGCLVAKAHKKDTILKKDLKLLVLINKSSASASEVFSGAIKDNQRGILLGVQSFGKGSVQSIFKLPNLLNDPNGSPGLKITTAHYFTPSGKNINHIGITPNIIVPLSPKTQVKLAKARSLRYKTQADVGINPMPPGISKLFPQLIKYDDLIDNQLIAALNYFRELKTQ